MQRAISCFSNAIFGVARPSGRELERLLNNILARSSSPTEREECCQVCGGQLSWHRVAEKHCKTCIFKRGTPCRTIALSSYDQGLGLLLAAAKYGGWDEPLRLAGKLLGAEIHIRMGNALDETVIVPMPSPWIRTLHRGIDHSMVIANEVSNVTGWPIRRVLKRHWAKPQVGLSRAERMRGGKGLLVNSAHRLSSCVEGKSVVLIDDVRTTGASLDKASRKCIALGAKQVIAGVLAMQGNTDCELKMSM